MPLSNPPNPTTTDSPTGAIAQTFERRTTMGSTAPTTGRLWLSAIKLNAGTVITSISFSSGSTVLAGGTHGWFALFSPTLVPLGQSTDDTSVAWAANTVKTYSLSAQVTVPTTDWYYIGGAIAATTMPTVSAITPATSLATVAPSMGGISSTSLTATAPNPAAAISAGLVAYGYVS